MGSGGVRAVGSEGPPSSLAPRVRFAGGGVGVGMGVWGRAVAVPVGQGSGPSVAGGVLRAGPEQPVLLRAALLQAVCRGCWRPFPFVLRRLRKAGAWLWGARLRVSS